MIDVSLMWWTKRFLKVFFVIENVDNNEDENEFKSEFWILVQDFWFLSFIFQFKYSRVGLDWETHQTILKTEDSFDFQWRATPREG